MRRQLPVPRIRVVITESRNLRVLRPVLLLPAQHTRKQRQRQVRRVFGVEQRILALGQPQLAAQIVDRLRPLPAHKPRQPLDHPPEARHRLVRPRHPWIRGQNRRIESGEERERRQHIAGPLDPRHLGHQRPRIVQFAQQQQIGPLRLGRRIQQIIIRLAQRRKQKLPQPPLRTLAHVVNHLHLDGVGGVDIRPNRVKFQPQRHDLRLEDRRYRHPRHVPTPLQLQRNRDQWIDVAEGPDVRQNNAQMYVPGPLLARSYEGNASGPEAGPALPSRHNHRKVVSLLRSTSTRSLPCPTSPAFVFSPGPSQPRPCCAAFSPPQPCSPPSSPTKSSTAGKSAATAAGIACSPILRPIASISPTATASMWLIPIPVSSSAPSPTSTARTASRSTPPANSAPSPRAS